MKLFISLLTRAKSQRVKWEDEVKLSSSPCGQLSQQQHPEHNLSSREHTQVCRDEFETVKWAFSVQNNLRQAALRPVHLSSQCAGYHLCQTDNRHVPCSSKLVQLIGTFRTDVWGGQRVMEILKKKNDKLHKTLHQLLLTLQKVENFVGVKLFFSHQFCDPRIWLPKANKAVQKTMNTSSKSITFFKGLKLQINQTPLCIMCNSPTGDAWKARHKTLEHRHQACDGQTLCIAVASICHRDACLSCWTVIFYSQKVSLLHVYISSSPRLKSKRLSALSTTLIPDAAQQKVQRRTSGGPAGTRQHFRPRWTSPTAVSDGE